MDKYNEALERAKKWEREHPHGYVIKDMMEYIFPGLRESEDERIRKHLVAIVELYWGKTNDPDKAKDLAYLEKQKYPNEDYLNNPAFLDGFDTGREVQKIFDEPTPVKLKWNEEDEENYTKLNKILYKLEYPYATDDDVDYSHKEIVELRKWFCELKDRWIWEPNDNQMSMLRAIVNDPNNVGAESCHLAMQSLYNDLLKLKEPHYTKRNALFDKCVAECDPAVMKEVSDEIDEMLEKEQKPIYIEGYGDTATVYSDGSISCKQKQKPAPTEDMPHITVGSILKLAEEELLKGFVVQKPEQITDAEIKESMDAVTNFKVFAADLAKTFNITHQRDIDWHNFCAGLLTYLERNKPAEWSEEDSIGWDEAFACVTRAEKAAKNEEELQNAVSAEKWLKEIKFKYYVHPVKQEWSDEDEKMRDRLITRLNWITYNTRTDGTSPNITFFDENAWLKSLRPQPKRDGGDDYNKGYIKGRADTLKESWKPSEEQMNALDALNCHGDLSYIGQLNQLISLYNDLKKLM